MRSFINKRLPFILLMLSFFLSHCSLFRSTPQKTVNTSPSYSDTLSANEVGNKLIENQFHFDWMKSKVKAHVSSRGKDKSINMNIRMRRDSIIWISVQGPLGMEMARALITSDSVKMIDRSKKKVFIKDIDFLQEKLSMPLQFSQLQALLSGNCIFCNSDKLAFRTDTFASKEEKQYVMKARQHPFNSVLWIGRKQFSLQQMQLQHLVVNQTLTVMYKEIRELQEQRFPYQQKYVVRNRKSNTLTLEFKDVQLEGPYAFPFSIPDKYEKVF